ncbi:hypothetical protein [Streptomyces varsoviensis]|uniref:Uncharacterized protein n=1 Tax=Streptomyces varsoviensis TaxID=67373 RepID=A0ABR5IX18_9ACTN|nr:hypothetical protein [Streptomyces varsoviensis]KOG85686.1 hypothetical protein ADK38_35295 [Streptomyces varsoviensis]
MRLKSTSPAVGGGPETRVVVYTPHDEVSRELIGKLCAVEDPIIGCPAHARPLSEIRAALAT